MKVIIEITTDNSAFDENPSYEVVRILQELIKRMEDTESLPERPLCDINGNRVGFISLQEDE